MRFFAPGSSFLRADEVVCCKGGRRTGYTIAFMADGFGRFFWWLYHDNNAPGVMQFYAAFVTLILTAVLVWVTVWYVRLTNTMSKTMAKQLVASSQPDVTLKFTQDFQGSLSHDDVTSDDLSGRLQITNGAAFPIKVHSIHITIWFEDSRYKIVEHEAFLADRVISPKDSMEEKYCVDVPTSSARTPYHRVATILCSDLSGFSQHFFQMTDNGALSHYIAPEGLNLWKSRKRYLEFLSVIKGFALPSAVARRS